ncbi:MAG: delta-60 repeat domain-containing protein, partial [Limisphaerales bacterium]
MKRLNLIRTLICTGGLLLQLSTLCFQSHGAAGDVDLSFDPGSGVNGPVNAVAVQPDGKVIIGGQFTMVKGLQRTNLARLNADGSGDATFNPIRPYNAVDALALQSDGKVLVGGNFWLECDADGYCSSPTVVVRLNTNGSLDNSFNPVIATYYNDYPQYRSLVVQSDGKVLIAGDFYAVNGTNRNGIARLNTNGSVDNSFD